MFLQQANESLRSSIAWLGGEDLCHGQQRAEKIVMRRSRKIPHDASLEMQALKKPKQ